MHAARAEGLDVDMVYETIDPPGFEPFRSAGPMRMPCTAALVAGGPNPAGGRRVLEWILGGEAERRMAASPSHNAPVDPGVASEFPDLVVPPSDMPALATVADSVEKALAVWGEG